MTALTRRPTTISTVAAAAATIVALLTAVIGSIEGGVLAVFGASLIAVGLFRSTGRVVDIGAGSIFVAVVVAGVQGLSTELVVVGTIAAIVAWDLATNAIKLGIQLGREAQTTRLESVHVIASVTVGVSAATVGYGAFVFGSEGQPVGAIVLLVLAVLFLLSGLRR